MWRKKSEMNLRKQFSVLRNRDLWTSQTCDSYSDWFYRRLQRHCLPVKNSAFVVSIENAQTLHFNRSQRDHCATCEDLSRKQPVGKTQHQVEVTQKWKLNCLKG